MRKRSERRQSPAPDPARVATRTPCALVPCAAAVIGLLSAQAPGDRHPGYDLEVWTTDDGLPQNTINAIDAIRMADFTR